MPTISESFISTMLAVISARAFYPSRYQAKLAALCFALVAVLCGTWNAAAQTAHFSGAQSIVASNGLSTPHGVAVDASGNAYIADVGNNRILKETRSGGGYVESTVASAGLNKPAGVAVDTNGNVFIADTMNSRILKETLSAGTYTESTVPTTGLQDPLGIAVDQSGNLFITDSYNARVIKETYSGGVYTQSFVMGSPTWPDGVAVDAGGNVYVCAPTDSYVAKLAPVGNSYTGAHIGSMLGQPHGVAVDAAGNVYIADGGGNRILKETLSGSTYSQSVIESNGLNQPQAITVDSSGALYFNDPNAGMIYKLSQSGANFGKVSVGNQSSKLSLVFTFDTAGSIGTPSVVTQGIPNLDFTDAGTGTCTTNGTSHTYAIGDTCTVDVIFKPKASGERFGAAVLKNSSGSVIAMGYAQGTGLGPQVGFLPGAVRMLSIPLLGTPNAIAADSAGDLYISEPATASGGTSSVVKEVWDGNGYTQSVVASGLNTPAGVAVDGAGNVYIADLGNRAIYEAMPSAQGYLLGEYQNAGLASGIAVDGAGNVYFASFGAGVYKGTHAGPTSMSWNLIDHDTNDVKVAVDGQGDFYTLDGTSLLKHTLSNGSYVQSTVVSGLAGTATGIAVSRTGDIYFTDGANSKILKESFINGAYVQSVVLSGSSGDLVGVTADQSGNLYFVTEGSDGIWRIDYIDPPSLSFASTAYGATSSDSPQTVTVQNAGNAVLTFPIPSNGSNPSTSSSFTLSSDESSACPLVNAGSATAGTLAPGDSCKLSISFDPSTVGAVKGSLVLTDDSLNATTPLYATQSIQLSGAATQATPAITWAAPAAIVYGTALNSSQLNASSTVVGTFSYSPASGTVLSVGQQMLTATFTPTDTTDYAAATKTVQLTVNQAAPTIAWAVPAAITYGTSLSATQLDATASVPGTFVYTPAAGTVPAVGSDTLSVTFTPNDTTDYSTATASVSLTVNPGVSTLSTLSPAYANAGGSAFTLTITGTGFVASSTIYWGSTALTTTYVSATQLSAQITAAQIAATGTSAVTVQTPSPGGGTSNAMAFEIDSASSSSSSAPTITTLAATVTAGATANYPVTLPSTASGVSVSCLNLPANATCSYSSSANAVVIATSSNTPAGIYQITVVFTENVSETAGILLPILLLPLFLMRRKLATHGTCPAIFLGVILLAGSALAIGCSGSSSGTQAHQVKHSGTVTLTVK